jgi:hypothetical protein
VRREFNGFREVRWVAGALFAAALCLVACQTVPPLPPANLSEPGWTVRQGQAVWRRQRAAPGLAGDLILATRPDGRTFVQFSKSALPILTAQSTPDRWEVESPTENKRHSGHGRPPAQLIFLYLPRALAGQPLPKEWSWRQLDNGNWRLENHATGASLEGYFTE